MTERADRMDPGPNSNQATAVPCGPRRPLQEGRTEEILSERTTGRPDGMIGRGFTKLAPPGPNTRPVSDRPEIDCELHSVPLSYAAMVEGDGETADHGRVWVLTATKACEKDG